MFDFCCGELIFDSKRGEVVVDNIRSAVWVRAQSLVAID